MAKKSASDLKAEGAELGDLLATARKRPLNFALQIAKDDGVVLEAHPTKAADVMWRNAKGNGGSSKGVMGIMNVNGKLIELTLATDDTGPGTLIKQTKKHLKERGLAFKVVLLLPGGQRVDDGEGDADAGTDEKADIDTDSAEGDAKTDDSAEALKAALTERLQILAPKVKDLIAQKSDAAEKMARGLQAVAAELASDGLEKAEQVLTAIEKAVEKIVTDKPSVDTDALRQQLKDEFSELADDMAALKDQAAKGVASKTEQLEKMFMTLVQGEDLKKAAAVLGLIKTFVNSEMGKLAEATGSILGAVGDILGAAVDKVSATVSEMSGDAKGVLEEMKETVTEIIDDVKEVAEDVKQASEDFIDSLTETGRKKLDLQALGFSEADQDRLVAELETNPNAIKEAKAKLVTDTKLPAEQQAVLNALSETDPKAFAAALEALKTMDPGGALDTSPDKMQAALEALELARKASDAALAKQTAAQAGLDLANTAAADAGGKVTAAQSVAAAAAKAIADYQAALPDLASMSEAERNAAVAATNRLINANEQAKQDLAKAQKEREDAVTRAAEAQTAKQGADQEVTDAKAPFDAAKDANKALEAKKGMMDALAFGRLSPDAKPAFKDEDKASFLAAFAKDGALADSAMDLAARSEDPSVVARNVGFVADKMNDGFADAAGNKLDLPEEDRRAMAENAMRMGALQGEAYFEGFGDYLKTGKQLLPDPYGGMDKPLDDPKLESERKNKVALGRTSGLGAAALGEDGQVDFSSDKATGAMDHMMFHPGSLTSFTPQLNDKMAEVKGLFADGTTGPKAQGIIDGTKLPADGAPGKLTAQKLVGGTMGKAAGDVSDNDAKASVLSAMMTPLSQGPVGSCFSTAPVRAIRETDPLRAMDEYSKIATTGQFKAKNGKVYPANLNPPKGENPLMRSWEYSVATAAANERNSREKKDLRNGLMGTGGGARDGLRAMRDIIPNAEWASSVDPATGDTVPGVRAKLQATINSQLKFEYDAGPPIGAGPPAPGGDGRSTDGGYVVKYKGSPIKSQADFCQAIVTISLGVTGDAADSDRGKKIVAMVNSNAFLNDILKPYNTTLPLSKGDAAPWQIASGGFENQTAEALDGGTPLNQGVVAGNTGVPPQSDTVRTTAVLAAIMTLHGGGPDKGMMPLGTFGTPADPAAHAFNTLPNHPSLDKIKGPNSAALIQSELVAPGLAIAAKKLPAAQAAAMFDEQLQALAAGAEQDERDLLIAALKNRPTLEMTPAELQAKVATESQAYRDAIALKRRDTFVANDAPTATNADKASYLVFYQNQVSGEIKAASDTYLINKIDVPEVVIGDVNWGGPEGQSLFIVAPDPVTGDLVLWEKDKFSGKIKLLDKNWADGPWDTVK